MAIAGDVYEIVDTSEFNGQKVLNVFFYEITVLPIGGGSTDVCTAYIEQMLPLITAWQSADVVHTSVKARNLFDDVDAHEELISVPGADTTGDPLGTFEAVPFRLAGNNAAVRNGAKRFPGLTEGAQTNGVIDAPTVVAALADLGVELSAAMLWGVLDAGTLVPVIVKRILVTVGEYRLPANQGEAVLSRIVDAIFSPLTTSQVSRKVGRGE